MNVIFGIVALMLLVYIAARASPLGQFNINDPVLIEILRNQQAVLTQLQGIEVELVQIRQTP